MRACLTVLTTLRLHLFRRLRPGRAKPLSHPGDEIMQDMFNSIGISVVGASAILMLALSVL